MQLLAIFLPMLLVSNARCEDDDILACFVDASCNGGDVLTTKNNLESAQECLAKCKGFPNCTWYTWDPANPGDEVNTCTLYEKCKSGGPRFDIDCADCVSGEAQCRVDAVKDCFQLGQCHMGEMKKVEEAGRKEECLQVCLEEAESCLAFSFFPDLSECHIWSDCPFVIPDECQGGLCITGFLEDCHSQE